NYLVADPAGNFIYHLEPVYEYATVPVKFQILQVDRQGEIYIKQVPIEIAGNRIMDFVFADTAALYLLEQRDRKVPHQRVLHRYTASGLKYDRRVLTLPNLEGEKNASSWRFAGHQEERLYFYSTTLDTKTNRCTAQLIEVDATGTVLQEQDFRLSLNAQYDLEEIGSIFLFPTSTCNAVLRDRNYSHSLITRKGTPAVAMDESYPSQEKVLVALNLEQGQLVMAGLYTIKGTDAPVLFARGFDLQTSEQIWKFKHLPWKQTLGNKELTKTAPYPNNLNLRFLQNGALFAYIRNNKSLLSCEIDTYGELIAENMILKPGGSSSNRMEHEDALCYRPGLQPKSSQDLVKKAFIDPGHQQVHPYLFEFDRSAVLIRPNYPSEKIELYLLGTE
ncbi:MAG: hypothetical protein KDC44_20670, partial [Phaeodactylibacter sp.]|nr:hypothetical protein [Phaeodactylibacter sp.]